MNETDTPETDAAARAWMGSAMVPWDLCRKLERERDEARREAEASWDCKWPKPFWSWRTKDDA